MRYRYRMQISDFQYPSRYLDDIRLISVLQLDDLQIGGKAKVRPKVGRPDQTETVGPTKWARPVSVQLRSGLFRPLVLYRRENQRILSRHSRIRHL